MTDFERIERDDAICTALAERQFDQLPGDDELADLLGEWCAELDAPTAAPLDVDAVIVGLQRSGARRRRNRSLAVACAVVAVCVGAGSMNTLAGQISDDTQPQVESTPGSTQTRLWIEDALRQAGYAVLAKNWSAASDWLERAAERLPSVVRSDGWKALRDEILALNAKLPERSALTQVPAKPADDPASQREQHQPQGLADDTVNSDQPAAEHAASHEPASRGYQRAPEPAKQPVSERPQQPAAQQPDSARPQQPAPEKPAPEQPAPGQPAPEQPAPEQPAPEQPAPEQPAPEQPAPEQPRPERPKPDEPIAEKPAPELVVPRPPVYFGPAPKPGTPEPVEPEPVEPPSQQQDKPVLALPRLITPPVGPERPKPIHVLPIEPPSAAEHSRSPVASVLRGVLRALDGSDSSEKPEEKKPEEKKPEEKKPEQKAQR